MTIETANWHAKVTRKDYSVALYGSSSGVDDPDQLTSPYSVATEIEYHQPGSSF